jgi:hypothetical protein
MFWMLSLSFIEFKGSPATSGIYRLGSFAFLSLFGLCFSGRSGKLPLGAGLSYFRD